MRWMKNPEFRIREVEAIEVIEFGFPFSTFSVQIPFATFTFRSFSEKDYRKRKAMALANPDCIKSRTIFDLPLQYIYFSSTLGLRTKLK